MHIYMYMDIQGHAGFLSSTVGLGSLLLGCLAFEAHFGPRDLGPTRRNRPSLYLQPKYELANSISAAYKCFIATVMACL